jgi:Tfp pilus assembly protein PilF
MRSISALWQTRLQLYIRNHGLPILVMLFLVVITYYEVAFHSFLINWDDQDYITKNPAIRGFSMEHLKMAFTRYYVGNYAPVQIISYMLDYTIWGLRPFGFILTNVVCHFFSGILLYFIFIRQGVWKWGAVFGTALFLLHPVQMESVAWVSQRKNLLAMLFFLMAFHAWLSYRDQGECRAWKWYVASIFFYTLSLLSKSVVVIFPIMLIFYDVLIPSLRCSAGRYKDKIPYILAALAVGVIAIMTQTPENGGGRVNYPDNLVYIPLTMLPVLASYLGNLLWPVPSNLCVMYFPDLKSSMDTTVFLSICLAVFLVVFGVFLYRRVKSLFFWYAFFFLGLAPVSQVIPLVTLMNDRYLYFPMLGVAGVVACLSTMINERVCDHVRYRCVAGIISLSVLLLLSFASVERGRVWNNTITLFGDAVVKLPTQPEAWSRLAEGYVHNGDIKTAKMYYEKASEFGKLSSEAMFNLAQIYLDLGEFDKAYNFIKYLQSSEINFKEAQFFLGEYYYKTGALQDAELQLKEYIKKYPDYSPALFILGNVYALMNMPAVTREYYSKAVYAGGNSAELFYSFACLESTEGNVDKSLEYLQRALELGFNKRELLEGGKHLENARRSPLFRTLIDTYLGSVPK